jgi:CBS domain-containing protein
MNAADIMTRNVITADPDATVQTLVKLMLDNRISAVPIVEAGALVGIVSEGDLVRRAEVGTEPRHSRWLELFASSSTLAAEYIRTHGRHARDVMTTAVVVVRDSTPIGEIAETLEQHRLKRVPVLDEMGVLVGIITRANILQALASRPVPVRAGNPADDLAIRTTLLDELNRQGWAGGPDPANIIVEDGTVHLWGRVGSAEIRRALVVAAENTPGVKEVVDHMDSSRDYDPMDRPNWPTPALP